MRGLAFKVAQQQRVAVRLAQRAKRVVEMWCDVFPDGVGFIRFVHGGGLLFAGASAHVGADGVGREILRRAMQPAGQNGTVCELVSGSREGNKHALRHVLGQVRVANHAQRGGIDEVNVPAHQFGEGHLRPGLGVIAQKLLVGQIVHS